MLLNRADTRTMQQRSVLFIITICLVTAGYGKVLHRTLNRDADLSIYPLTAGESLNDVASEDRVKRAAPTPIPSQADGTIKVHVLPDKTHTEAIIHWSGDNSKVMFILTRKRSRINGTVIDSKLYRSTDYGTSFNPVKFSGGTLIQRYFLCPRNKSKLILTDVKNKMVHVTEDEGKSFQKKPAPVRPDWILFHPTREKWVLLYSEEKQELYMSKTLGKNGWNLVSGYVNPRFYWGTPGLDNETFIHMEMQDPLVQGRYYLKTCGMPYCTDQTFDNSTGSIDVSSLLVLKGYMFIQKTTAESTNLYISYPEKGKRSPFRRGYFPGDIPVKDCYLLDADEQQVFLAVKHLRTGMVNLYVSDTTGRFYVESLQNIKSLQQGVRLFNLEFTEVRSMNGTYIANRVTRLGWETVITLDQGGQWRPLTANSTDYMGHDLGCAKNCKLNLHIPSVYSDESAPGFIFAEGSIAGTIGNAVFLSKDGGVTWGKLYDGNYKYRILDQGGAMVLMADKAKDIMYSCTEGNTWKTLRLSDNTTLTIDGVVTEPGLTTQVVSVFGHSTATPGWILIKVDFASMLKRVCNPSDYYTWRPGDQRPEGEKCILGQELSYRRRKPNDECYNGRDYRQAKANGTCLCTKIDFECDFGYEKVGNSGCVLAHWYHPNNPVYDCPEGTNYTVSRGYRKVAADKCSGGDLEKKYKTEQLPCPIMAPDGLTLTTNSKLVAVGKDVAFYLHQERGSKLSTIYAWKSGNGNGTVTKSVKGPNGFKQTFKYDKPGTYNVTVTVTNKAGSKQVWLLVRAQVSVSAVYVLFPTGAKVNTPVTFEAEVAKSAGMVHYMWTFGDETGSTKPVLTWGNQVSHIYKQTGEYTVFLDALNGVSAHSQNAKIIIYEHMALVQLSFNTATDLLDRTTLQLRVEFADILKMRLAEVIGIDYNRLSVSVLPALPTRANVSILPPDAHTDSQTSVDQVVKRMQSLTDKGYLKFPVDQRLGQYSMVQVTKVKVIVTGDTQGKPGLIIAAYVVPAVVVAVIITILLAFYYKRKCTQPDHYRLLHRAEEDTLLGEEEDLDDDPMIDPNPASPAGEMNMAAEDDRNMQPFGGRSSLVVMA